MNPPSDRFEYVGFARGHWEGPPMPKCEHGVPVVGENLCRQCHPVARTKEEVQAAYFGRRLRVNHQRYIVPDDEPGKILGRVGFPGEPGSYSGWFQVAAHPYDKVKVSGFESLADAARAIATLLTGQNEPSLVFEDPHRDLAEVLCDVQYFP